jgi:hypothetical protein
VLLDIEVEPTPELLQRPDGESVFRRHGSQRYTSEQMLAAENRLVDVATRAAGPVVSTLARDLAICRFEKTSGKKVTLNPGQRALVEHFVSSGRELAVAIGPPGTGKSTAMRAVREAWETTGGRVIGFAPSAVAAGVLGDELGVQANTRCTASSPPARRAARSTSGPATGCWSTRRAWPAPSSSTSCSPSPGSGALSSAWSVTTGSSPRSRPAARCG